MSPENEEEAKEYGTLNTSLSETDYIDVKVSYWKLLKKNRDYRFFLTSYLITHGGEWLTYIASIDFIERSQVERGDTTLSRTSISVLVLVRLLPNVLFSGFGGTLADAYDRRKLMTVLDVAGAICALFFVLACQLNSISLIYLATFLQQSVAGLYEPSSSSIVPLLVRNEQDLQKATILAGLVWSAITAFGAAASGFIVDALGSRTCFMIDSATYLSSAFLLFLIRGEYNVSDTSDNSKKAESPWEQTKTMTVEGARYLSSSFFSVLVFLKASASLAYGACDVLNVVVSELGDPGDSNRKVGILFSVVGIGCLLGPLVTEPYIDVENPKTVQLSCVLAFALSTFGYLGWSIESPFWCLSLVALIRSAGSSIIWINSTLLLQKFSAPEMLGRVLAADYAFTLLTEALSAYVCGVLIDQAGLSVYGVSFVLAGLTMVLTMFWSWYHVSGRGAGKYKPEPLPPHLESPSSELSSLL